MRFLTKATVQQQRRNLVVSEPPRPRRDAVRVGADAGGVGEHAHLSEAQKCP